MKNTQESSANIVAEMRDAAMNGEYDDQTVNDWADRLEAALKRERLLSKPPENNNSAPIVSTGDNKPGNTVAMYSCLLKILAEMIDLGGMECGRKACFSPDAIADEIRQALAVPPRNCDVGTAEEQEDRFFAFCKAHECTMNCPIKKKWSFKCGHKPSCGVLWSQMPYEAKEGGAK